MTEPYTKLISFLNIIIDFRNLPPNIVCYRKELKRGYKLWKKFRQSRYDMLLLTELISSMECHHSPWTFPETIFTAERIW